MPYAHREAKALTATERYYVRIGSQFYAVEADTASHAIIEALASIDDTDTWPGDCEVWNDQGEKMCNCGLCDIFGCNRDEPDPPILGMVARGIIAGIIACLFIALIV